MYTREQRHREGFYGLSKRAVFVVDRGGTVRYAWITDDSLIEPDVNSRTFDGRIQLVEYTCPES